MFTNDTKNLGVWKQDRRSFLHTNKFISKNLFTALATLTFVSWFILFVIIAIKKDFFIVESFYYNNNKISKMQSPSTQGRPAALNIFISQDKNNEITLLFDDGKVIKFNEENAIIFDEYMENRRNKIEILYMIMKLRDRKISRIKIWPDRSFQYQNLTKLLALLSSYGYDDFDIVFAG